MKNKPYPYIKLDQAENIWKLVDLVAKKYGNKDAFVFKKGKEVIHKTFRDFHDEAHALAAYFINEGLQNKMIAILGENSYDWILTWFGIVLSGNIAVPVDKLLLEEQIFFILNDIQAETVVHSKQYAEMVPDALTDGRPLKSICMEDSLFSCIEKGAEILKASGETTVPDNTDKHATAQIIYTSGTTGIAKGVCLTQDNLCFDMNSVAQTADFPGHNLFVLPLNHVYAFQGVLVFMVQGVTTYISASLKRVSQEMKEYSPYAMCVVPLFLETMYAKVMDGAKKKGIEKKLKMLMKISLGLYSIGIDIRRKLFKRVLEEFGGNLTAITCGGAPLDVEYAKAFRAFGIHVMVGYGITECSPVLTGNRNHYYRDGSVGLAIPGVEIKTNALDGKSEGELYVRGRMMMQGYYNNEEATKEAFEDGWYKTGDVGYIDKDGFVFITGRKKNIIILSNGKNLYPEELELQLMKVPGICEVIVRELEKQVTAEVFPDLDWINENGISNAQGYFEEAIERINKRLPLYKNITKVRLRDKSFPKTSTQKIRRNIA